MSLILWTLQLLTVLEATSHVFEHFPGIGKIEQQITGWSFGVSLTIAVCVSVYRWNPLAVNASWVHSVMRIGWTIHIVCAGVLLVQLILGRLFANFPMSPNLLVHRRLMLIYFVFVSGVSHWAVSSNPIYQRGATLAYYLTTITLLACWLTLMSPEKEYVPVSNRPITKEEIEELDRQIEGTDRMIKKWRDGL